MKRTALLRRTPLRSKPKSLPERAPREIRLPSTPGRKAVMGGATSGEPVHKEAPLRSEGYRRLVAALPCFLCGIEGRSQAAHADTGKGLGLKSDDRTCYPLCADAPGVVGCHTQVGAGARFTREERRAFELRAAAATRARLEGQAAHDPAARRVLAAVHPEEASCP